MPQRIVTRKGLDIPLRGMPRQHVGQGNAVRSVAVLGGDYVGLRPKMAVQAGDRVALGQPLFFDKADPEVAFTAPGSGVITAVNRGPRRTLLSVVIDLDDEADETSAYAGPSDVDVQRVEVGAIRAALCRSGLWTSFRTRPYGRIPTAGSTPRSIFVTAVDTRPLAADPATIVAAHRDVFATGLAALARLPERHVYLCTGPAWSGPAGEGGRVQHVEFSGPHPAGLVGTHIHHLDPVGPNRCVWHLGYQDVIAIGRLFREGSIAVRRTVALGGEGFKAPRLVETRLGASIEQLVAGELAAAGAADRPLRVIAGSALHGRSAAGAGAYLGRYDLQITALPEGGERRLFGWLTAGSAVTFAGMLRRRGARHRRSVPMTTALHGRRMASVPVEAFEHVMPLDILPAPLLRALLIKDTAQAQALGCLELDPEDLSLCSFVCPAKHDYGAVLKVNLEQIEREG